MTGARRAALALSVTLALAALGGTRTVRAEDPDNKAARERCATRLSIALLGTSPGAELLAAADPQAMTDSMLASAEFVERFARFTNATMNTQPGLLAKDDVVYFIAKDVLASERPWRDLFVGGYGLVDDEGGAPRVVADPDGLGYFRADAWSRRYAGNEPAGYRLSSAYRMLRNTVGLELVAVTTAPEQDVSAAGRRNKACAGCHYDSWFALDKVARVLSRRVGTGADITFAPPTDGPQVLLDGATVSNDKELVTALVDSEAFRFSACRTAFRYVTGREETRCEGPTFDACMAAFGASGSMRAAVAAIAKAPGFCQ